MQHDFAPIRTRPDGSIDTAYYIARSRRMRGDKAAHLAGGVTRGARRGIWSLLRQLTGTAPTRA